MELIQVEQEVTRKEALYYVEEVLFRFNNMLYELQENPSKKVGNSLGMIADEIINRGFTEAVRNFVSSTEILDTLSTEGYTEFLKKCGKLSEKYRLEVRIPEDVVILGEDVVEDFLLKVTEKATEAIKKNEAELETEKNRLLGLCGNINLTRTEKTDLDYIIEKSQEYHRYKEMEIAGNTELSKYSNHREKDPSKYQDAWSKIQTGKIESEKIEQDCPIVSFMSGNTEPKIVKKEINKAYTKAIKSNHKIREMLLEGTFPIWELTPIVNSVLETVTDEKEKEQIVAVLSKMETKEKVKDILLTLVPIGLSILCFFIPGGANLLLLGVRAGLQTANAVVGVVSAINDIQDARLEYHKSWSDLKLTDEQIDLIDSMDVNNATIQYLTACVSAGFVVFDVMDAVKAYNLIGKCNALDDVTRSALKQSKRFGEKAFQNIDVPKLNYIGQTEKATKVFDNISTLKVEQIPVALDFFPNNLNTNVIWLGMDNIEPQKVLTCSENVCKKYNTISNNVDLAVSFSDNAKSVETKMNNLLKYNNPFDTSEKIALLKETLPPNNKLNPRTTYIRVQTVQKSTFAQSTKPFAWVTDPYVLTGNDLPNDFLRSVGFPESSMKVGKDEKIWFDVVVFKDVQTANKYVPDEVVDWNRIKNELADGINKANSKDISRFQSKFPDLITEDNKFNTKVFEEKYLDYFMNQHVPGTKYTTEYAELGDIIYDYTGASDLFTGSGITSSANGLENIERGFNNIDEFEISKMRDYRNVKIFRFEVQNDTSKAIKRVYIREVK